MIYLAWALILVVQNAAFTWVSRARNSGSLPYHALAAVFSNGTWFCSQFIMISVMVKDIANVGEGIGVGLVYVTATTTGSVLMHWVSMKYLEKGKRKVGT